MATAPYNWEIKSSLGVFCLALVSAVVLVMLMMMGNLKAIAAVVAGSLCIFAAFLSGNPRLFSLWALMLTIPFDLSKRFGPLIEKMGGESSFRIEMSDPFLLLLTVYLLRDIARGRVPGVRLPKVIFPYTIIMFMGCMAAIFGTWHLTPMHEVVRMIKVTLLFVVICNELVTPKRVLHCAAGLCLGVTVQAIVGLIQYFTGKRLGLELLGESSAQTFEQLSNSSVQSETVFRISGFLVHPNVFGVFLAALIPMAIAFLLLRTGASYKALFASTAALGLPALIGTLSRSGWLSFAVAVPVLMVMLFLHPRLQRRALLAIVGGILAMSVVLAIYAGPISRRLFSSQDGAVLGREEYNRDAMRMIAAQPWLGVGLNCYVYAVPPYTKYGPRSANSIYQGWIPAVHNIYLLWFAETGVFGFILHLWILFAIIGTGIRNFRVRNILLFTMNAACLSALAAFMVDGFFSFSLRINSICRIFWVISGIIMAIRYLRLKEASEDPPWMYLAPSVSPQVLSSGGGEQQCINPVHQ